MGGYTRYWEKYSQLGLNVLKEGKKLFYGVVLLLSYANIITQYINVIKISKWRERDSGKTFGKCSLEAA